MIYTIEFTEEALAMLEEIQDRRERQVVLDRIKKLETEPEKQGKHLVNDLAGFQSVRAAGQRYRIVFEVQGNLVRVIVVGVGIRREGHRSDIYRRLTKFFNRD